MINIEKFICSLLADHPEGVAVRGDIHKALKEQGLEYKDGKIVPIEDKPELKESDERIRKALITAVSGTLNGNTLWHTDVTREEALAWLEKIGEHLKFCKTIQIGDRVTRNEGGVLVNMSQLDRVAKPRKTQGEQKPIERKDFISIPFGAFDSELVEESITIPDGCVATIEGNKIHIKKK